MKITFKLAEPQQFLEEPKKTVSGMTLDVPRCQGIKLALSLLLAMIRNKDQVFLFKRKKI